MGTECSKVTLEIDGVAQTCKTMTATEGKFTLTGLKSETANVVNIWFDTGLPNGHADVKKVTVTPNLVSITPSSGSKGGTLLTVVGTGFGTSTSGLTLVDGSGADVCAEVKITGYGTFTCLTKPSEITEQDMKIKTAAGAQACGNT